MVIVVTGLIVFLICYFRAFAVQELRLAYYILAICLIGVALSEINTGASIFFIYAAAFSGNFHNRNIALSALLSVLLFIIFYTILTHKSGYFWIPAVFMSVTLGMQNIHRIEILQKNRELKESQQQIKQLAETAERERISRDLHDLLGHTLSVITLKSALAAKMIDKNLPMAQIRTEIKAVEKLSRETLSQVRGAVRGYNTATIDGELLQAKVATQAATIKLIENIEVTDLNPQVEAELALIIREAITNVIRHADTETVCIALTEVAGQIKLTISDEGQMITKKEQSGMQNMRVRTKNIGGEMTVTYLPNTHLEFVLPVTDKLAC
ncbi:MAG: sensor histidine kinase [Algicola sp.]|nr:sensor histidine kinase [Algicola sp.]